MEETMFNPEWDAQTLAEAAAINANSARLAAASAAAGQLKIDAEKKAEAFAKVGTKVYDHPTSIRAREDLKTLKSA